MAKFLIKGKEIQVELARNSSNPSLSKPSENYWKVGEI